MAPLPAACSGVSSHNEGQGPSWPGRPPRPWSQLVAPTPSSKGKPPKFPFGASQSPRPSLVLWSFLLPFQSVSSTSLTLGLASWSHPQAWNPLTTRILPGSKGHSLSVGVCLAAGSRHPQIIEASVKLSGLHHIKIWWQTGQSRCDLPVPGTCTVPLPLPWGTDSCSHTSGSMEERRKALAPWCKETSWNLHKPPPLVPWPDLVTVPYPIAREAWKYRLH